MPPKGKKTQKNAWKTLGNRLRTKAVANKSKLSPAAAEFKPSTHTRRARSHSASLTSNNRRSPNRNRTLNRAEQNKNANSLFRNLNLFHKHREELMKMH